MNREFKFRAWDKETKEYIYDLGLNLFVGIGIQEAIDNPRFVVEQFTGLLDKDGKEIYEGDILRRLIPDGYYRVCEWEGTGWNPFIANCEHSGDGWHWGVAGNIHENPELLNNG